MIYRFFKRVRAARALQVLVARLQATVKVQRWYRRRVALRLWQVRRLPPASVWRGLHDLLWLDTRNCHQVSVSAAAILVLQRFARLVVAKRRHRLAATMKRGARVGATQRLQAWWRGCSCRHTVRPVMEARRVDKIRRQLDAWRMMILQLQDNVRDVLADIKSQVGGVDYGWCSYKCCGSRWCDYRCCGSTWRALSELWS